MFRRVQKSSSAEILRCVPRTVARQSEGHEAPADGLLQSRGCGNSEANEGTMNQGVVRGMIIFSIVTVRYCDRIIVIIVEH